MLSFYMKHLGQTLMVQVAKRGASVLKRRKSRNRMESTSNTSNNNNNSSSGGANNNEGQSGSQPPARSESTDGDVVFYTEEPRSGKYVYVMLLPVHERRILFII